MIKLSYKRRDYQEDIIQHVKLLDNVVELGCHVGTTTKIISKLNQDGTVYAFDNSPESASAMNNLGIEYGNIEFNKADVRNKDVLYNFTRKHEKINVLCIDLGGGYHPDTVFKVFFLWSSYLKPNIALIRNRGLMDFVNSTKTSENIKSEKGYLSSSANEIIPNNFKSNHRKSVLKL